MRHPLFHEIVQWRSPYLLVSFQEWATTTVQLINLIVISRQATVSFSSWHFETLSNIVCGHRACFHATMLTNTVVKVTFGDLGAQQISAIIFHCSVLYHTEFDFLWLFIHLRPRKNGFKYFALLINIFIYIFLIFLLFWQMK